MNEPWHSLPKGTVLETQGISSKTGLSSEEAAARLQKFGKNKMPEQKKRSPVLRFLTHFHNVLIYILLAAAVITALMNHWIDTWVILAVVLINALIGFFQEGKAEKALDSIRNMLSLKALIIRGGNQKQIDAEDLVPGDIVLLKSGDRIPADMRVIQTSSLSVEESPLTGESEAVSKHSDPVAENALLGDRKSMLFSGTILTRGSGSGVVTATGSHTEIGKINTMMTNVEKITTPLLEKIASMGKALSFIILGLVATVFGFGFFFRDYAINELFLSMIGVAVAAIPEGLPAIMTITLAMGVQRMAKRHAIIRNLPSVETLGAVSVICTDKTGTLTKNEMTARSIVTAEESYTIEGAGYAPEGKIQRDGKAVTASDDAVLDCLMRSIRACNNSEIHEEKGRWELVGTPTEGALITLAHKAGYGDFSPNRIADIPFESEYKYMATLNEDEAGQRIYLKGAPDALLGMCDRQLGQKGPHSLDTDFWKETIERIARSGQRVIAAAYKAVDGSIDRFSSDTLNEGLVFVGIVGIIDPPRPEAVAAVAECRSAGIQVKMITGDHAITAATIAKEIGIISEEKAITGAELEVADDDELKKIVLEYDVFARTTPEHKLKLVQALQANGLLCAMTGDGVNDAPALKQSNIGIAMGIKGTEVTKDASEMVLADDNFASIVNAVEEGRTVYDNIRKALLFILPTNGTQSFVLIVAILLGLAIPITPVQILWVNMITAITLALALSFEPMEKKAMERPPRNPDKPILGGFFVWRVAFVSLILGGLTMAAYTLFFKSSGGNLAYARTIAVNTLVAGQAFYLFNCRKIHDFALGRSFFTNKAAFVTVLILAGFQILFTYAPFMHTLFGTNSLAAHDWLYIFGTGVVVFVIVEIEKAVFNTRIRKNDAKRQQVS